MGKFIQYLMISFLIGFFACKSFAEKYPLRKDFKDLTFISKEDLLKKINETLIVDTRSTFEYETAHIINSINIDFSTRGFLAELKDEVQKHKEWEIIFYCNGILCKKSYEAAKMAQSHGFKKVLVYDEGILPWAKAYPDKTLLLGQTPANLNLLPDLNMIEKHSLNFSTFKNKIEHSKYPLVVDLREPHFREYNPNLNEIHPIRIKNFIKMLMENHFKDNELFIYDSVGKQIEWVSIYLKSKKNNNEYWFLKGGVDSLNKTEVQTEKSL